MTIEEVRKLFSGNSGYLEKDDNGWTYVYESYTDDGEYIYIETSLKDVQDNGEPCYTKYDCCQENKNGT